LIERIAAVRLFLQERMLGRDVDLVEEGMLARMAIVCGGGNVKTGGYKAISATAGLAVVTAFPT
jgi:hypothetical protein